jgi:hypothetical protein
VAVAVGAVRDELSELLVEVAGGCEKMFCDAVGVLWVTGVDDAALRFAC